MYVFLIYLLDARSYSHLDSYLTDILLQGTCQPSDLRAQRDENTGIRKASGEILFILSGENVFGKVLDENSRKRCDGSLCHTCLSEKP
eukprot:152196-Amorphochlora_amoeboformis.AAC.1